MWNHIQNIQFTAFIANADFPEIMHKVTDGYIDGQRLLFEANSSFYIIDLGNYLTHNGFSDDWCRRYGIDSTPYYFHKRGAEWFYSNQGVPKGQGFMRLGIYVIQEGEYKFNVGENTWKAQYHEGSDENQPDRPNENQYKLGHGVYKSATLTGVYVWEGLFNMPDIKVGWHHYTHKALDSEGNQTNEDVNVFESEQLYDFSGLGEWLYEYNNSTYRYTEDLPEGSFIMENENEDTLNMTFVALTSIIKDKWKFDGGAQIVD